MKWLSERLTDYVIKTGVVSKELYAVYQYGFQIGLEMFCCFTTCFIIAICLHIISEFIIFTGIFILLRTYAGGIHLNSIGSCFICSVAVQTVALLINIKYQFPIRSAWVIIMISSLLIYKLSPVESISRELDKEEKKHCKKATLKIIISILIIAGCCTIRSGYKIISLIAITMSIVLFSQCLGIIKFKLLKKNVGV